jgi:hypothetical protein
LTGDAPTDDTPVAEPEPEDNSKSYEEYLAELAEKKLALGAGIPEARKPNEGKQDKKWANAKPIAKEDEEDFVAGSGGKAKRVRERAKKEVLEIDQRFVEAPDRGVMDHPEAAVATVTSEVVVTAVDVDVAMEASEAPEEVPHEVVPDPHPLTRRIPAPSQPLDRSKQSTRPTYDLLKWFDFFLLQNMSGCFGNDPMSKRRKICASCSF